METVKISKTLMQRLPLYLEHLKSQDDYNISATSIAEALGLGEVQVRKDLAKVSCEGRRRTGRCRQQLIRDIEQTMDRACLSASILVCTDSGIPESVCLPDTGVRILACFVLTPTKPRKDRDYPVYSIRRMETFCKHYNVRTGIINVPAESAQLVCDGLIACGIQHIWNFSSACLTVPQGVFLQSA